ncbi:hypothetical protein ACFQL1_16435 [Halomicroarcula sp. GCM10025709]|uniref:hypothetical protein n=1 Tax=Halomicroarcula sp. GCM10025709 TaxID=3252669 RepID=UPI00361550D7
MELVVLAVVGSVLAVGNRRVAVVRVSLAGDRRLPGVAPDGCERTVTFGGSQRTCSLSSPSMDRSVRVNSVVRSVPPRKALQPASAPVAAAAMNARRDVEGIADAWGAGG